MAGFGGKTADGCLFVRSKADGGGALQGMETLNFSDDLIAGVGFQTGEYHPVTHHALANAVAMGVGADQSQQRIVDFGIQDDGSLISVEADHIHGLDPLDIDVVVVVEATEAQKTQNDAKHQKYDPRFLLSGGELIVIVFIVVLFVIGVAEVVIIAVFAAVIVVGTVILVLAALTTKETAEGNGLDILFLILVFRFVLLSVLLFKIGFRLENFGLCNGYSHRLNGLSADVCRRGCFF